MVFFQNSEELNPVIRCGASLRLGQASLAGSLRSDSVRQRKNTYQEKDTPGKSRRIGHLRSTTVYL